MESTVCMVSFTAEHLSEHVHEAHPLWTQLCCSAEQGEGLLDSILGGCRVSGQEEQTVLGGAAFTGSGCAPGSSHIISNPHRDLAGACNHHPRMTNRTLENLSDKTASPRSLRQSTARLLLSLSPRTCLVPLLWSPVTASQSTFIT